jgi:hypothetical protein
MEARNLIMGRYEIQELLNQSGPIVTYRVFDVLLKRNCALKTFRELPNSDDPSLQKECEILARISHPNVIEVFDRSYIDGENGSWPFFVMPFLPGLTLEQLIAAESRRLTPARVVEFMSQVCRGMQAAHDSGAVQGDVRTGDILVMKDDSVKITGFGAGPTADTTDDVLCLGMICYEALALRKPPSSGSVQKLSGLNSIVPEALSSVIHRAIDKNATNRFVSAQEFGEALVGAIRNEAAPFGSAEVKVKSELPLAVSPVSEVNPLTAGPQQPGEFTQFFKLAGGSVGAETAAGLVAKPDAASAESPPIVSPLRQPPIELSAANLSDMRVETPGEFTQYFIKKVDNTEPVPAAVSKQTKPGRTDGFPEGSDTRDDAQSGIRRVIMPVVRDVPNFPRSATPDKAASPKHASTPIPEPFLSKDKDPLCYNAGSDPASDAPGNYTRIIKAPIAPRPVKMTGTNILRSSGAQGRPEVKGPLVEGSDDFSRVVNQPRRASTASDNTGNQAPVAPRSRRSGIWMAVLFGALGFAAVILVLYFALKR